MRTIFTDNKNRIVKTLTVMVFPFLGCVLYCYIRGTSFFNLYLPNSYNNDVLFYYKLVEGMVNGGITGYFGFNESHAVYGGFAAWNPVIVMPWAVWGLIFGWNYMSPFICNIFLFSCALGIFVLLVNPKWKSLAASLIMFLLFPSLWIHLMNGLPESIVASNLIVFIGLMICYSGKKRKWLLWTAVVIASFLTITRPYMVIFLLYALICMVALKDWKNYIAAIMVCVVTAITYVMTNHYLTAAYFEPLYDMSLIKAMLRFRIKDAYYILGAAVKDTVPGVLRFIGGAFSFGSTAGTQYFVSLLGVIVSIVWVIISRKKEKNYTGAFVSYAVAGISLLAAIVVLLGKPNEGGRHCFAFAIAAVLLIALTADTMFGRIINGMMYILLVIFICRGSLVPTDYDIPMPNEPLSREIEYFETVLVSSDSTGYDNTIIWALSDTVNGSGALTDFHCLYAVPAGMGISCCNYEYILNNMDNLKSRYIAVIPGGYFEDGLLTNGYIEIGRVDRLVVYEKR